LNKDQAIGATILIGSVAGMALYAWLMLSPFAIVTLQITAFLAVAAVLAILAWIGWTMATTPPSEPIDFENQSTSGPGQPSGEGEAVQSRTGS